MRYPLIQPTSIGLLVTLILVMNLFSPYVTSSETETADQTDMIPDRGVADSPWPMLGVNSKHTGLSKYNTSDNPGKIKEIFEINLDASPQPIIETDGIIFLEERGGYFQAIYPNGTQKWHIPYRAEMIPVLGSDGILYLTSYNKDFLLAVFSSNGTIKWEEKIDAFSSPVLDENDIIYFITNPSKNEYKLNAYFKNGTEKWNLSL